MPPVSLERQIQPGTFEHTLNYLVDQYIDLSVFEGRYDNDDTGAPAIGPGGSAEDRPVRLFSRHHFQPRDRPGV